MDFINYAARLEYLTDLARKDNIPSPHVLGKKFECSERTVRRMINILRDKGFVSDDLSSLKLFGDDKLSAKKINK